MASLEFRLRKTNQTRNCLSEEIKHNDLMSEKCEKTYKYLNYVNHLFILVSTVTGCISIFCIFFISLCSCWYYKFCSRNKNLWITAGIKKYKSIIKKKRKKHNKTLLLEKDKLNAIEVLISKVLIALYISHHEFVSVNNVLREYDKIKEETKNPEMFIEYTI